MQARSSGRQTGSSGVSDRVEPIKQTKEQIALELINDQNEQDEHFTGRSEVVKNVVFDLVNKSPNHAQSVIAAGEIYANIIANLCMEGKLDEALDEACDELRKIAAVTYAARIEISRRLGL
jgi:hypothetical protein